MQPSFNETLRQKRKEQKLTIKQLAKDVGCSKSYISQLENGATKPSLTMLGRLVKALNAQMTDFFDDTAENNGDPVHKTPTSRQPHAHNCLISEDERRTIYYPDGKTKSQFLTNAVYQKKMQPILTIIEPGGGSNSKDNIAHPEGSEEFLFVLNGEIDFKVENQRVTLRKGDTFYFDGTIPHRWKNNGNQVAEILFIWSPAVW